MSFRTYEKGPDFDRAREQISTPFQYFDWCEYIGSIHII